MGYTVYIEQCLICVSVYFYSIGKRNWTLIVKCISKRRLLDFQLNKQHPAELTVIAPASWNTADDALAKLKTQCPFSAVGGGGHLQGEPPPWGCHGLSSGWARSVQGCCGAGGYKPWRTRESRTLENIWSGSRVWSMILGQGLELPWASPDFVKNCKNLVWLGQSLDLYM